MASIGNAGTWHPFDRPGVARSRVQSVALSEVPHLLQNAASCPFWVLHAAHTRIMPGPATTSNCWPQPLQNAASWVLDAPQFPQTSVTRTPVGAVLDGASPRTSRSTLANARPAS